MFRVDVRPTPEGKYRLRVMEDGVVVATRDVQPWMIDRLMKGSTILVNLTSGDSNSK
jgi:hypothetical protein